MTQKYNVENIKTVAKACVSLYFHSVDILNSRLQKTVGNFNKAMTELDPAR